MNASDRIENALKALFSAAREIEQDDVLAFLRKRRAAAETMAQRSPEEAEYAGRLAAQIGIEIEMIAQGLHVGDAEVTAALEGKDDIRDAGAGNVGTQGDDPRSGGCSAETSGLAAASSSTEGLAA